MGFTAPNPHKAHVLKFDFPVSQNTTSMWNWDPFRELCVMRSYESQVDPWAHCE